MKDVMTGEHFVGKGIIWQETSRSLPDYRFLNNLRSRPRAVARYVCQLSWQYSSIFGKEGAHAQVIVVNLS